MSRSKNLYVIRLDRAVLKEPKFEKENPGYRQRAGFGRIAPAQGLWGLAAVVEPC